MTFSSLTFLFYFLPIFLILYVLTPNKYANITLLLGSFIFYSWGLPGYSFLLIFIVVANYLCGIFIDRSSGKTRKLFLVLGLSCNLGILAFFKYLFFTYPLLSSALKPSFSLPHIKHLNLIFPIGISFITFKVMAYIIDVYRGRIPVEKNFLRLSTHIAMFPLITAGPIVRYETVVNEMKKRSLSTKGFIDGIKLFIIGLASKVILADHFSVYADTVFSQAPEHLSVSLAWLGAVSYTLQIYFDFAGYSIMAIGIGKMIGFNIPDNFRLPYLSQSVTEFWRRWHITLTSWFRDYLYIPLGGNRKSSLTTYRNLFIVFLLCGIWHGSNLTFLIWGIYHGVFLIIERSFRDKNLKIPLPGIFNHIYLTIVVTVGWVIFRSENLHYALNYIALMFGILKGDPFYTISMYFAYLPLVAIMLLGVVCSLFNEKNILSYELKLKNNVIALLQFACYSLFFFISVIMLVVTTHNSFIYNQF